MILSYLTSWEFWRNVGVLFVASFTLGPILYAVIRMFIALLTAAADDSSSKSNDEGCGCFIMIGIALLVVYGVGKTALTYVREQGWFSMDTSALMDRGRDITTVAIFAKEAPLLYEYYNSLLRFEDEERAYLETLKQEMSQISSAAGKAPLAQKIRQVEQEIGMLVEKESQIEEFGNRLYFARYMQNLGINIDDRDLKDEMSQTQQSMEKVVAKQEQKKRKN